MSTSRKGEMSLEFLVFIGIILVFFVFFFAIIGGKTKEINQATIYSDAQGIADKLSDEIGIAARFEGYYREFSLPQKLVNGENYSITLHMDLRLIEIKWGINSVMSTMMTDSITGNFSPGINRISNVEGVLVVES
ncbi:MAG: hypothetical protein JW700_03525 [Candidatus Aenigmarchaeota archaeon]|nr:hypothetical protein [Candidatus Aenigmarchaeota archaeon]